MLGSLECSVYVSAHDQPRQISATECICSRYPVIAFIIHSSDTAAYQIQKQSNVSSSKPRHHRARLQFENPTCSKVCQGSVWKLVQQKQQRMCCRCQSCRAAVFASAHLHSTLSIAWWSGVVPFSPDFEMLKTNRDDLLCTCLAPSLHGVCDNSMLL